MSPIAKWSTKRPYVSTPPHHYLNYAFLHFLTKNVFCDEIFFIWRKIDFVTKYFLFDEKLIFDQKLIFLTKNWFFDHKFIIWPKNLLFNQKLIFESKLIFYPKFIVFLKFRLLNNIERNFYFFAKISIFNQNYYFKPIIFTFLCFLRNKWNSEPTWSTNSLDLLGPKLWPSWNFPAKIEPLALEFAAYNFENVIFKL